MRSFTIPTVKWLDVPLAAARREFDLKSLTNGQLSYERLPALLQGVAPKSLCVHRGNVVLSKSLGLFAHPDSPKPVAHVIAGNLTIDGAFTFEGCDAYTPLIVMGELRATDIGLLFDATLMVEQLTAERLLYSALSDAGTLLVKGAIAAGLWLDASGRGLVTGTKTRSTKRVVNPDDGRRNPVLAHLSAGFVDDGMSDDEAVVAAIAKGKAVLRTKPRRSPARRRSRG